MKVGVGGTFNILHRGHRALLDAAIAAGDDIVVGITSDRMAREGREEVRPVEHRADDVRRYLQGRAARFEIVIIDTPEWKLLGDSSVEVLIASPGSFAQAERINIQRADKGMIRLRLVQVGYVLADDCCPISSTRIASGELDTEGRMLRPIRARVGSDNPVKIAAAERVLRRVYGPVAVEGGPAALGLPKEPFGAQVLAGARERAKAAIGNTDYGIGIEAGVFEGQDGLYDVQYCAIIDKMGRVTIGHGMGFRYPPEVEARVRKGEAVGDIFRGLYGKQEGGRKEGAIGYLTKGIMNRKELSEQAVLAAMVPRIRKDIYFET
jgi:inosine/xanthosine triphosphatase